MKRFILTENIKKHILTVLAIIFFPITFLAILYVLMYSVVEVLRELMGIE